MGRRDEPAAQGSHEVLAGRVSWLWENRAGIPFDDRRRKLGKPESP